MQLSSPTISSAVVAAHHDDLRLLDCRARLGDPNYGINAFAAGHLPGALHADLDQQLAEKPGRRGRHPLPNRDDWLTTCRSWGLNDSDAIVVYDDSDGVFAARAWWLLRWLGHGNVALLDGGLQAWNGPLSQEVHQPRSGAFTDREPLTRVVSAEDIRDQLDAAEPWTLLDARAVERFAGEMEPIDHTAGHIPGAVCKPFADNLDARGVFKPKPELAARFAEAGRIVCYCGSGVTAAHNILAMHIAGLPEPALYPGSWSEWIEDPTRPIARGR